MVDLEDLQVRMRISPGEGVQTGAQHQILPHPARIGRVQAVLGVAAAGDHMGPERAVERVLMLVELVQQPLGGGLADDPGGEGIVQHLGIVEQLVGGPAHGHAPGGRAGFAGPQPPGPAFAHQALASTLWNNSAPSLEPSSSSKARSG